MSDKKSWLEVFLLPVVLAFVGITSTWIITLQQEANAIARANSERQVKILEIFAEKITKENERERELAIHLLKALDDELAEKVARAVALSEPDDSRMKSMANKMADTAKARRELSPRIYLHVYAEQDARSARLLEPVLELNNWTVPGIEKVRDKSPKASQLRYFRASEKEMAVNISNKMKKSGIDVALVYIKGYENSTGLRPMHFEIWFAKGEPGRMIKNNKLLQGQDTAQQNI